MYNRIQYGHLAIFSLFQKFSLSRTISLVCISWLLFFIACTPDKNDKGGVEKFPIINPLLTDTIYSQEYVADIHSIQNIEVRARVNGYLEKIHVDEGQYVTKGQLLFSISSGEYKEELAKAKAMVKSAIADAKTAEVDLQNAKRLVEKNVVSKTELDMAQSKFDALNAGIEEAQSHESSAKLRLAFTEVRAPFDGIIDRIPFKTGSLINEGTLLTNLSDNKEVFAYFNVSEREYLDFIDVKDSGKKEEVELILANDRVHQYKGVVETVDGTINKNTGNIAFRARFVNPKGLLKHGASGKVRLIRELKQALIVPQKSTFEIQDKTYLYIVTQDSIVHMQSIVPEYRLPDAYVIQSGVSSTDRIIYEGIQRVKEGDKVSPQLVSLNGSIVQLANH